MANLGSGAQVVNVTKEHTYELNETELQKLLFSDEIKDLPVVVVSIAGAYRGGKSFLLNFFIRYLSSPQSAREDGSWLGEDSQTLGGFKWRKGIDRTTTGILMWSKPFITSLPNGNKVAVLLMDTQGSFDDKSTVCDWVTVFAISTLISSVQIYNLSKNIQENYLQELQLFTEYGKMVKDQGAKPFQELKFLVRDWQYPEDYANGALGGKKFLENKFKATVEAGLLLAMNEARELYEKGMDADCGPKQPSVPTVDVQVLHNKRLSEARDFFNNKKKMGSKEEADKVLDKLEKELDKRLPQFVQSNVAKMQAAINKAREAYDRAVKEISKGEPLCVHPTDLENVRKAGLEAAVLTFDAARKRMTKKPDDERTQFIQSLDAKYLSLSTSNNTNNLITVVNSLMDYSQYMQPTCLLKPPLSDGEFTKEHEKAQRQALLNFDSKRTIPSAYTKDEYKDSLTKGIHKRFMDFKITNKRENKAAILSAITVYDNYMKEVLGKDKCLHPVDLDRENQNGLCRALVALRPKKQCSVGFDAGDEDESSLAKSLRKRYKDTKKINESANETAVQEAYSTYVTTFEDLRRPKLSWFLIVPMLIDDFKRDSFNEEAKTKATDMFYSKRRDRAHHSSDSYKENLDKLIADYYMKVVEKIQASYMPGLRR